MSVYLLSRFQQQLIHISQIMIFFVAGFEIRRIIEIFQHRFATQSGRFYGYDRQVRRPAPIEDVLRETMFTEFR
jgi:hypothetical protein